MLLAVADSDTAEDIAWLSGEMVRLRIFNDEQGVMNLSVLEIGGEVPPSANSPCLRPPKKEVALPTFVPLRRPSPSRFTNNFIKQLTADLGKPIQTGEFGADMGSLTNDGPVTILIDSKLKECCDRGFVVSITALRCTGGAFTVLPMAPSNRCSCQ